MNTWTRIAACRYVRLRVLVRLGRTRASRARRGNTPLARTSICCRRAVRIRHSSAIHVDALNLRKAVADGLGTPSDGHDTPASSLHGSQPPQLFQVLEQTSTKVGGAAFGSSHGYVVPPAAAAAAAGTSAGASARSGKAARPPGAPDVELALDPAELERLDEASLKARYEKLRQAQREASAPEDVSDIIAEQERKRKRKMESAQRSK